MITISPFKKLRRAARKRAIAKWNKYVMVMKDFISAGTINGYTNYVNKLSKIKQAATLGLSENSITKEEKKELYDKECMASFKQDILFISDLSEFDKKRIEIKPDETETIIKFLSKTKDRNMKFMGLESYIDKICPDKSGLSDMIKFEGGMELSNFLDRDKPEPIISELEVAERRKIGGKRKTIQKKIKRNNTLKKRKRKKKIKRN